MGAAIAKQQYLVTVRDGPRHTVVSGAIMVRPTNHEDHLRRQGQ